MSKMGLMKGKRGEREVVKLLQPIIDRVYSEFGIEDIPSLQRNTLQSDKGGYDLVGLDWIAIEVKHQEQFNINGWWKQTVAQAKKGQQPTLFYRKNFVAFNVVIMTYTDLGMGCGRIRSTVSLDDYLNYFERRLRHEIAKSQE